LNRRPGLPAEAFANCCQQTYWRRNFRRPGDELFRLPGVRRHGTGLACGARRDDGGRTAGPRPGAAPPRAWAAECRLHPHGAASPRPGRRCLGRAPGRGPFLDQGCLSGLRRNLHELWQCIDAACGAGPACVGGAALPGVGSGDLWQDQPAGVCAQGRDGLPAVWSGQQPVERSAYARWFQRRCGGCGGRGRGADGGRQ
jgi:hypothetical protein